VLEGALALEGRDAGALSIVLEAITHRLAEYITVHLSISTIGIGAGPSTSMEVLVWDDMMMCCHGKRGASLCNGSRTSDTRRDEACKNTLARCAMVVPKP
jgi:ketopantoate hydroxymethyltransferase